MPKETAVLSDAERRKDVRREVHLRGMLFVGGKRFSLEIGDLSVSGALILFKDAPPTGTTAELWIEDYGPIDIEVKHSGAYSCGVAFAKSLAHDSRFQHWLRAPVRMQQAPRSQRDKDPAPLAADAAV